MPNSMHEPIALVESARSSRPPIEDPLAAAGRRRSGATLAMTVVTAVLLGLATLPPLLVGFVGLLVERERTESAAQTLAWIAEREASVRSALPPDELAKLLLRPRADASVEACTLNLQGTPPVGVQGDPAHLTRPTVTARHDITTAGHAGAFIEVTRSLADVLLAAAMTALVSVGLTLVLWRVAIRRPMGALRRAELWMRAISRRDPLTGLHNREGLRARLQRALERCQGTRRSVGVLLIDLDRFRFVNESLGQPAGDQLLRGVADRIRAVTRADDVVARLGGDQFAVLVEGLAGAQAANAMARNLLRAFEPAYVLNGHDTVATLSIGVAIADESAQSVDDLLKHADAAMRAAKAVGGGRFRVYEPGLDTHSEQQLDMDLQLRRALQGHEFGLMYQPIADMRAGRIVGVEALIRWNHPVRGAVSPVEFIPMLEQTGLIVRAGRWVLEEACRQAMQWMAAGAQEPVLSVNVSPREFAEPDFVDSVHTALARTRFPAHQLQLEVTEGLLLDPTADSLAKLDALSSQGIRIAVDDFGMGYSSLAYLKQFRLSSLKIDRVFVRDISLHRQDAAIIRAIIDLGHSLALQVTAEGVETAEQFHELRRLGCDSVQGFLIARPMSGVDMSALLTHTASTSWRETNVVALSAGVPFDPAAAA
jgi:diguanylate cyclase (GGDEF)-like protein